MNEMHTTSVVYECIGPIGVLSSWKNTLPSRGKLLKTFLEKYDFDGFDTCWLLFAHAVLSW